MGRAKEILDKFKVDEGIEGTFGKFGFLSSKTTKELKLTQADFEKLSDTINDVTLDDAAFDKIDDPRVNVKTDGKGMLIVKFPVGVVKNKKAQQAMEKIIKNVLSKVK